MFLRALIRLANTSIGLLILRAIVRPKGLFLCYPVEDRFADHFCSKARQKKVLWTPYLVGILIQGQSRSLTFAISSNERSFSTKAAEQGLRTVTKRMDEHKKFFSAEQVAYAGVLPTMLRARRILGRSTDVTLTCSAVAQAVVSLAKSGAATAPAHTIVLGGRGFVGRNLVSHLNNLLRDDPSLFPSVLAIDKNDSFPGSAPVIIVNCTLPGAIDRMVNTIPRDSIIINEVYPAPSAETVAALSGRNISVIHVAGVEGFAWPAFPGEYIGAIPCCSAMPGEPIRVVTRKIQSCLESKHVRTVSAAA